MFWDVNRVMKGWGLGEWPVLMEESSDIYGALCLKRHDASFHLTVLISFKTKNGHRESGKNIAVLKRAMSKKSPGWSAKDWTSKSQLAALCRRRCRTEFARPVEMLETSSKVERNHP